MSQNSTHCTFNLKCFKSVQTLVFLCFQCSQTNKGRPLTAKILNMFEAGNPSQEMITFCKRDSESREFLDVALKDAAKSEIIESNVRKQPF